jgi:hypothetical protein
MNDDKRAQQVQQMIDYLVHEVVGRADIRISADMPLVSSGLIDSMALVNILLKL